MGMHGKYTKNNSMALSNSLIPRIFHATVLIVYECHNLVKR